MVIPKEIREILRISEGDELIVDVEGDRVLGYYIRMPNKV
ncbi:MAG: AbrB/MazE/SpoVT family DNA-binding domain-containing protein [Thermodesulfovibrionales bacterium]